MQLRGRDIDHVHSSIRIEMVEKEPTHPNPTPNLDLTLTLHAVYRSMKG
jgi:hypothetical protein